MRGSESGLVSAGFSGAAESSVVVSSTVSSEVSRGLDVSSSALGFSVGSVPESMESPRSLVSPESDPSSLI